MMYVICVQNNCAYYTLHRSFVVSNLTSKVMCMQQSVDMQLMKEKNILKGKLQN